MYLNDSSMGRAAALGSNLRLDQREERREVKPPIDQKEADERAPSSSQDSWNVAPWWFRSSAEGGCREDGAEEGNGCDFGFEGEDGSPSRAACSRSSTWVEEEGGIDGDGRGSLDATRDTHPEQARCRMRFPKRGPRFDVWNHLESGLDQARAEFPDFEYVDEAGTLPEDDKRVGKREQEVLAEFAEWLFSRLSSMATTPEDSPQAAKFDDLLTSENAEPWIDFAMDIRFAEEGVRRALLALERYNALPLKWNTITVSEDAQALLREAIHAYLFGFDAPCIAFCGIALERVLKDSLVTADVWTAKQAFGEKRTAWDALGDANERSLVRASYPQAEMLIRRRNHGVHSDPRAGSASDEAALDSLRALGSVLEELGQSMAQRVH